MCVCERERDRCLEEARLAAKTAKGLQAPGECAQTPREALHHCLCALHVEMLLSLCKTFRLG